MDYDLCVIGGGINGSGIARDAAGRGLSVLLVEAQDLAQATSSASTKLVHGGLRYLEHYEFRLVRESLLEREVLLNNAPHIIWPMEFILPHDKNLRPYRLIQLGLKLYDFLGGRKKLKKSEAIDFKNHVRGTPLKDNYKRGFSYADCWIEDSRMVTLNALDAKERGATVLTRTACVNLDPAPDKDAWEVTLEDTLNGDQFQVKCKCIVNAAGPWVRSLLDTSELSKDYENKKSTAQSVRLVKGSHIIVPQIYEGDHSYILQQDDNRIVFAIPYEKKFTLIGTTDKAFDGDPSMVEIDDDEKQYLCGSVNRFFQKQITPNDIVSSYSGVRPLVDDGEENASKVTRDYKIHLDKRFGPAIFSVFGGKITTFRKLSEEVVDRVTTLYPNKAMPSWTETVPLPGGDIPDANFDKFVESQQSQYSFAPKDLIYRYARAYGTRMDIILGSAQSLEELGTHYGDDIYESELLYLIHNEFALTVDDILWRRSKLLLHISAQTISKIESALPVLVRALKEEERQYA